MTYNGIIFDFNGVLLWDSHLQEQAWKTFSREFRGTAFSDEEIQIHMHGRNNRYTLEYLAGHELESSEVIKLSDEKESIYKELCLADQENFVLSPGAINLLDQLVKNQIPHTIATASGKANLEFFIQHLHLEKWFDIDLIVYDDGTRPGKPAPDIYLTAASRLNLPPAQCMVVEDSLSGIHAASKAGIGKIVALGPIENHETLQNLKGVHQVIQRLDEIEISDLLSARRS